MVNQEALGFGLVAISGFSLVLGNLFLHARIFTPSPSNPFAFYEKGAMHRRVLTVSLALGAGVLTFLSFTELYPTSLDAFTDEGTSEPELFTALTFFGGVIFSTIMELLLSRCCGSHGHGHGHGRGGGETGEIEVDMLRSESGQGSGVTYDERSLIQGYQSSSDRLRTAEEISMDEVDHSDYAALRNTYVLTALSLALHNLPEGLAILVATLDDTLVGLSLAVAVILHNFPLGLSLSLTIYETTRSKWKAFFATLIVGLFQVFGALIGYYLLEEIFEGKSKAVLFGGVGGMMTFLAIKELLPTARENDSDNITDFCFFLGAAIVAGVLQIAPHHSDHEH